MLRTLSLGLFLACCLLPLPRSSAADLPNIVIILADDLGYGDLGCYNAESKIPTPNLDRLAAEGLRFTDAHTPSSVCSPTRYGLLTGRYAWRTRLKSGVLGPFAPPLIEADRLTLAAMLKQHGYQTACVGKWHLGWTWATVDAQAPMVLPDRRSNVNFDHTIADGPTTRGFDMYFGTDVPNYPPYVFISNDRTLGIPAFRSYTYYNRPGPMLPNWRWVDILPELSRRAVGFIDKAVAVTPRQPFFLYLPLTSPHFPVVPTNEFRGKSGAGEFGDFVAQTDHVVGQILDALETAGVADNTLVIFTSDNGPEITGEVKVGVYDRIQQYGHASMGPLRGAKRDTWEGGHRVPFIVRWPGHAPAGETSDQLICLVDMMATLAALVDHDLPQDAAEDSWNMLSAFKGQAVDRGAVVHHGGGGTFAIRQGDWVYIDGPSGQDNGAANGEPAWFRSQRGYEEDREPAKLYNLAEDLAEAHNRRAEQPERAAEMKRRLDAIRQAPTSRP